MAHGGGDSSPQIVGGFAKAQRALAGWRARAFGNPMPGGPSRAGGIRLPRIDKICDKGTMQRISICIKRQKGRSLPICS